MSLSTFDDLLQAARQQPEPQRLLFVFASAELPDDATPEQRAAFAGGRGGALVPLMCVDKTPDELPGFAALAAEAAQFGKPWAVVFVAGMSGQGGVAPSSAQADAPLKRMVDAIKAGTLGGYVPFDAQGRAVNLR